MNRERSTRYAAVAIIVVIVIVVAVLALYPRHFEVTLEGEGSVSVSEGDVNAIEGETVSIVPADGWFIASVTVDGTPVTTDDGNVTIEASLFDLSSITIHVVFSERPVEPVIETHTVTVTHTDGGVVTPSGEVVVEDGDSLTIRMTPDSGFAVSSVTLDGITVDTNGIIYTVERIVDDHTVHVTFTRTEAPGGGEGGGSGGGGGETTPSPSPTLIGIEVTAEPYRTVYSVGDIFDTEGMVVTAHYSDGTDRVLSESEYSVSPSGPLDTDDTTITISYGGKTDTIDITVGNQKGFSVTVTELEGTRVSNGSVSDFSETTNTPLNGFSFHTTPIVPGITQTATMTVSNTSGINLDAVVYIQDLKLQDGAELAEQIVLTVTANGVTESATISEVASGTLLDLGTIASGADVQLTASISFPHSDQNNEAMGQSLTFTLGVFADVPPEGA